jgi:hypothetical protein
MSEASEELSAQGRNELTEARESGGDLAARLGVPYLAAAG